MNLTVKTSWYSAFLFLLCFINYKCLAQDTIIKRDGQQIIGKVLEVSTTEVKYRKWEMADGPVYIDTKSSIERINYQNGSSDVFPQTPVLTTNKTDYFVRKPILEMRGKNFYYDEKRIGENQLYKRMLELNNPELNAAVKKAKKARGAQYIGFGAIPLVLVGVVSLAISDLYEPYPPNNSNSNTYNKEARSFRNAGFVFLGAGAICLGTSIYFKQQRKASNAAIVRMYKQKYE